MGYYTTYTVSATTPDGPMTSEDIIIQFNDSAIDVYDEWGGPETVSFNDTWYDCDTDMIMLSTKNADTIYRVHGIGEETGDEWVCFYVNGKREHHDRPAWQAPETPNYLV